MTKEEKSLLIKELCARLPYRINILTEDNDKGHIIGVDDTENGVFVIHIIEDGDSYTCDESIENFKPYLRPMSSMTEEEREEFRMLGGVMSYSLQHNTWAISAFSPEAYDWLNKKMFDYRGLIEKGLALEAEEGMYKTE